MSSPSQASTPSSRSASSTVSAPASSASVRTPSRSVSMSQEDLTATNGLLRRVSSASERRVPVPTLLGPTATPSGQSTPRSRNFEGSSSPDSIEHTLLEFLQNQGPHGDNSGQGAAEGIRQPNTGTFERKRRLTGSSGNAGQMVSGGGPSTDAGSLATRPAPPSASSSRRGSRPTIPGSSRENAIDLSGSPESVSRQVNSLRHRENSFTDYELPRWQPDSEVSKCPICSTPFSFWYRKHHCRKCGRVVCASCSPHRITIPRQFIVRPPEVSRPLSTILQPNPPEAQIISLIDDEQTLSSPPRRVQSRGQRDNFPPNSALGGGEEVRLCNPCVPDPNPEPPRRYTSTAGSLLSGPGRLSSTLSGWGELAGNSRPPTNRHSALPDYYRSSESGYRHNNNNAFHRPSASLSSATMPSSEAARELRRQRGRGMIFQPETPEIQQAAQEGTPDEGLPSYGSFDYTVVPNFRGMPPRYQSTHGPGHPHHSPPAYSSPSTLSPSSSRHRTSDPFSRSIPSHHRGQPHDIANQSASSSRRNRPLPFPPPGDPSRPHPQHHRPRVDENDICPICNRILPARAADGSEAAREAHIRSCIEGHGQPTDLSGTRTQQPSNGPVRMLPFTATEKDCMGQDGMPEECTICMEEYEVGATLARLECLCKFHKACIVGWLERKQECPVHKVSS
ncbi:hypothetical protein FQN52_007222 [Onygenales sp. PD_12]|nr:hypothetical protein FQN52_007222 [Onygenales sp. PD_12]